MTLIDKDAVIAEINKRIIDAPINNIGHQRVWAYNDVKDIINTLDVKEVDLRDSIKSSLAQEYTDYTFKRFNINPESKEGQLIYYAFIHGINICLLRLRTQKGE